MRYRALLTSVVMFVGALASATARATDCERVAAAGTSITVCRVDVHRHELHVFLNDSRQRPLHTFAALERMLSGQGKRLTFAMNAGMFHPDFSPVGLLIEQYQEVAPLNTASGTGNFFLQPNGVFFIDERGAKIVESSQFPAHRADIRLATQSGPLLVSAGTLHPRLSATSKSRFVRNGVGVDASGTVVFAASDAPLTLYEFATIFRDALQCPDALYLDGSITSVYAPALQQRIQRAALGPIIAVVEPRTNTP